MRKRCGTCKHWVPYREDPIYGCCERWLSGREHIGEHANGVEFNFPSNEVLVDDDTDIIPIMGHNFGCTLWEKRNGQS